MISDYANLIIWIKRMTHAIPVTDKIALDVIVSLGYKPVTGQSLLGIYGYIQLPFVALK